MAPTWVLLSNNAMLQHCLNFSVHWTISCSWWKHSVT